MEWKRLFQVQGQSRKSNWAVRYGKVSCFTLYLTFSYMYYLLYFLYQSFELCRESIAYCLNLQHECTAQFIWKSSSIKYSALSPQAHSYLWTYPCFCLRKYGHHRYIGKFHTWCPRKFWTNAIFYWWEGNTRYRKSLGPGRQETWILFPSLLTPERVTLGKTFGIFASISSPCKMGSMISPSSSSVWTSKEYIDWLKKNQLETWEGKNTLSSLLVFWIL